MYIYVETLLDEGKSIILLLDPIDTTTTIKARIQYQEGIVSKIFASNINLILKNLFELNFLIKLYCLYCVFLNKFLKL